MTCQSLENQKISIEQAVKQASMRSAIGMRYNEKWLLSCFLLRIKSPKAYSHLGKHQIFPCHHISHSNVTRILCEQIVEFHKRLNLLQEKVQLGQIDLGEFTAAKRSERSSWLWTSIRGILDAASCHILVKGTYEKFHSLQTDCGIGKSKSLGWCSCLWWCCNKPGMWKEFRISGCVRNVQNSVQHSCPSPSINVESCSFYPITSCIRNNLLNRIIQGISLPTPVAPQNSPIEFTLFIISSRCSSLCSLHSMDSFLFL